MGHYSDFKSNSLSDFFNVISAYPFAMICKNNQNTGIPDIVNVPVILSESGRRLEFHFARANPAWKNFTEEGRVRVVFNGPNAHVSPSWYSERFANGDRSRTAPTWDYVRQ